MAEFLRIKTDDINLHDSSADVELTMRCFLYLLEKKFLGKTKIMEGNFDRSFFTKADKRTLKSINTYAPKAKILTKQPVSSYEINDVGGNKVINITNPTLFWEKSDFLIIQIN